MTHLAKLEKTERDLRDKREQVRDRVRELIAERQRIDHTLHEPARSDLQPPRAAAPPDRHASFATQRRLDEIRAELGRLDAEAHELEYKIEAVARLAGNERAKPQPPAPPPPTPAAPPPRRVPDDH